MILRVEHEHLGETDASNTDIESESTVEHNDELLIVLIEELDPPASRASIGKTQPLAQFPPQEYSSL